MLRPAGHGDFLGDLPIARHRQQAPKNQRFYILSEARISAARCHSLAIKIP
jgi:hypothetical protein